MQVTQFNQEANSKLGFQVENLQQNQTAFLSIYKKGRIPIIRSIIPKLSI